MVLGFFERACLWFFRIVQWCLAVSLLGVSGHLVTEFDQAHHAKSPPEVWVPVIGYALVFKLWLSHTFFFAHFANLGVPQSAFAICHIFYSIVLIYCLGRWLLHIAAFFDLIFLIVYIVAIVLNRHNFHRDGTQNQLYLKVITARANAGLQNQLNTPQNETLVKAMVGLVVTMMALFLITALISVSLAHRADDKKEEKERRRSSSSRRRRSR